ncbi:unnamed protein product [Linum trigynum]|uniref:Cation/H+ exchanger domain-containing protein n=1 Tax=Linum trigynum TaxID=586398 RepID=A0AAV2DLN9_9ROSI
MTTNYSAITIHRLNLSGDCFDHVPVSSPGLWNMQYGESILKHNLVRLHLQLVTMIMLPRALHSILKLLRLPRITSEMLAGYLIGPNVLHALFPVAGALLFPPIANQAVAGLAKVGFIMFSFLNGVRMDPGLVKISGKKALALGFAIFFYPFTMVHTCIIKFPPESRFSEKDRMQFLKSTDIYLALITTSQFVGVNTVLMELKLINTQLGHLALASTLVSELLRFAYSIFLGYLQIVFTVDSSLGTKMLMSSLFFALMVFVIAKAVVLWLIKRTPTGKPMSEVHINFVIGVLMTMSATSDAFGVYYLFGPFLFGLVVPAGSPLATGVIAKLETVTNGLLLPLLLTFCSSTFDVFGFWKNYDMMMDFKVSACGYGVKLVLTFLTCMACRMGVWDASAFSLIVNAKGVLEVASFLSFSGLAAGEPDANSAMLLIFVLTTALQPLIRLLYDPSKQYVGYKRKSIQFASHNAELPVLTCAHKQEDAVAALKMLEFWNPTRTSPLSIYGLCLQDLVGSFTPQIINHQLGQKAADTSSATSAASSLMSSSASQPIVDVFNYFKTEFRRVGVVVSAFTAISPLKLMYEDICWMSFDKAVCIVIVPFHKKWNPRGQLVHESGELRNLNIAVLDRAPCSVGILIDRRTSHGVGSMFVSSPTYRVVVLFFGGADDRESMAIGGRMAGSPRVQLTVVRFRACRLAVNEEEGDGFGGRGPGSERSWDEVFDDESLRILRHEMADASNVKFLEEEVRDGSDTSQVVRSLKEDFDLIIVGRRHEEEMEALSGLSEWAELPELGPVGDILAGGDMGAAASVLVVQQQIMKVSHNLILNS